MANKNKLFPNTRFNNNDNMNIEILQPFGRIGFVTIRSRMKKKLDKRCSKAIMVGIPKYNSSDNYHMYNVKTKRIIISRDIKQAPFIRPSFHKGLDNALRPDVNREIQNENAQQSDENEDKDENNPAEDMNQVAGNDLDDMKDEVEEKRHPQVKGSRIRHKLKTSLNTEYFTPKHATRRSTDNQ